MFIYLKGVFREFKNIRWLSKGKVLFLTLIVLIASLVAGFFLGFIDNVLAGAIKYISK